MDGSERWLAVAVLVYVVIMTAVVLYMAMSTNVHDLRREIPVRQPAAGWREGVEVALCGHRRPSAATPRPARDEPAAWGSAGVDRADRTEPTRTSSHA